MYYGGSPFEAVNTISAEAAQQRTMYFKEKAVSVPFAEKIIETFTSGKMDLVIYVKANGADPRLPAYHQDNYGVMLPFHVEEYISPRTIKTAIFVECLLRGISVYHYDEDWRLSVEQVYDEQYHLQEYRQCYYENDKQTPTEEKFFFPGSWVIQKERY